MNPKQEKWLEYVMILVGVGGHLAFYVQAYKIIQLGSSHAVSRLATLIALTSMLAWFAYGVIKGIKPLIISNIFGIIGVLSVLWAILWYQQEGN